MKTKLTVEEKTKKIEDFYNWAKKSIVNVMSRVYPISPGVKVKIIYDIEIDGINLSYDESHRDLILSKSMERTFDDLGINYYDVEMGFDVDEHGALSGDKKYSDLVNRFDDKIHLLCNELNIDVHDIYWNGIMDGTYPDSDSFVVDIEELIEEEVQDVKIVLNKEYTAIVTEGDSNVAVGCQRIHIDKIKEIVEAWDELNS